MKPETLNLKPGTAVPVRPKHIDQYVHLLPESTQKKAAQVQGILRDIDTARENARLLAKANEHPDTIAQWAKATAELDKKLKTIYRELDAEWEKLVKAGRVTVDDFGNAHIVNTEANLNVNENEKGGDAIATQQTKQAGAEPAGKPQGTVNTETEAKPTRKEIKAAEKAKRLEYLKKWLRDTRTTPSIERKKMWEKNCKELISLGGEITDSIRKAAEFYGVGLAAPKE